ncbi:LOW QUALITY PROTEIN: acylamino-acid-releasing enzyme [Anomaloglossus baeobatrachus]|uniref:LOW QUALITY PROTEIN: acylamino-acid-releasing enzyme n=1 Tax=Anomaloglossus baeobatrachus TaxID=238106 RepID=UPI003F4FA0AB
MSRDTAPARSPKADELHKGTIRASMSSELMNKAKDVAALYCHLCHFPSLSSASIGPEVTTQYGGKYSNIYTEWSQRDLDRNEQVKFCRQYIVFHDNNAVVYAGACGNGSEIRGDMTESLIFFQYDWYTKVTSTVVDIIPRSVDGQFGGIYTSLLAPFCWSADSQRVIIDTALRSRQALFVVDTMTGTVTALHTQDAALGSWKLMTVDRDLLVVRFSSPNCPPTVKVGFLPPAGKEAEITWVSLEEENCIAEIDWSYKSHQPPLEQEHPQYPGLDFESVLLKPSTIPLEGHHPLVVYPHGGPHSVFISEWMLYPAVLCKMGFAVLLVNYRGSLGFGQHSVMSLLGKVGDQDVKDMQTAVMQVLQSEPVHPNKVALCGGSHGGFLSCHLIGQYPEFYKACVVRNPVTNIPAMTGSTDIPDWCHVESGLTFSCEVLPEAKQWGDMLNKSPIIYISKVKTPVLLMLGAEDRRVPNTQGLEYYKALRAHGVEARLLWYPGNNHALSKVDAESDGFMNIALWILKHLE